MKQSPQKNSSFNAFLPALGFVLVIALGAVSYLLSGPLHRFLLEQNLGIPANVEVQYLIAGLLWIVLMLFSSMMYAAFAPKPDKMASERQLKVEKEDKQKQEAARKKRQQEINRKVAKEREAKNQSSSSGGKR